MHYAIYERLHTSEQKWLAKNNRKKDYNKRKSSQLSMKMFISQVERHINYLDDPFQLKRGISMEDSSLSNKEVFFFVQLEVALTFILR